MDSELQRVEADLLDETQSHRRAMVSHLEDAALIGLQIEPDNTSLTFSSPVARDLTDTTTDDDLLASLDGENIISQIREKVNDLR
jgi:hypothetical protein